MNVTPALPKVASNFYYFCKKCDSERYHKVLAHLDSKSAKLECEVCHSKKTYKTVEGGTMAKKATKGTRGKRAAAAVDGNPIYKDLEGKLGDKDKEPYRMGNDYPVNAVIEHPKFGVGFVFAVTPEKIDVAFSDANRSLVQNRK